MAARSRVDRGGVRGGGECVDGAPAQRRSRGTTSAQREQRRAARFGACTSGCTARTWRPHGRRCCRRRRRRNRAHPVVVALARSGSAAAVARAADHGGARARCGCGQQRVRGRWRRSGGRSVAPPSVGTPEAVADRGPVGGVAAGRTRGDECPRWRATSNATHSAHVAAAEHGSERATGCHGRRVCCSGRRGHASAGASARSGGGGGDVHVVPTTCCCTVAT